MVKHGKKYKNALEKIGDVENFSLKEAVKQIKDLAYARFDESVDVDVVLGIDPAKGDQVVRGAVTLPYGRGKKVTVLVFAKGDYAEQAERAGADYVGSEDLIEKINGGWLDFTYAVATPDLMGMVGQLAKILGPRGLLPNKKTGTVTFDVASVVKELKKGQVFFKNDKGGNVHFPVGRISFAPDQLVENLMAFFKALVAAKPAAAKGKYLKRVVLSSTMGVGIAVNPDEAVRTA